MKVVKLYPGRPPRWVRISIRIMMGICLLVLTGLLVLQTGPAQEQVRKMVESRLEYKTGSKVMIGKIRLKWFSELSVEKMRLFDRQNQPVISSDQLHISFNLLSLLKKKLVIHELDWENVLVNVYTLKDHQLNYRFIINAFCDAGKAGVPDRSDTPGSAGSGYRVKVGRIRLTNLKFRYDAREQGIQVVGKLASLRIHADQIDFNHEKFLFREFLADGLKGFLTLTQTGKTGSLLAEIQKGKDLTLQAKRFILSQSAFAIHNESLGFSTGWRLKDLTLRLPSVDLGKMNINAGFISMERPEAYLFMTQYSGGSKEAEHHLAPARFRIIFPEMTISDGSFRYEDHRQKKTRFFQAFDRHHFYFRPLNLQLKQFEFSDSGLVARLQKLELGEVSGFGIRKANANILYNDSSLVLDGLFLETQTSRLANRLTLHAPSFRRKNLQCSDIGLEAHLMATRLNLTELLYFAPELKCDPSLKKLWDKEISVNGQISGPVKELVVSNLVLKDNYGNEVKLNGPIKNSGRPGFANRPLDKVQTLSANCNRGPWYPILECLKRSAFWAAWK